MPFGAPTLRVVAVDEGFMGTPREVPQVVAEFECQAAAATAARAYVGAALRVWDLDDLSEVAALLTTELVANAVVHARSSVRVVARHEPAELVVEVFDRVPDLPAPTQPTPEQEHGRGLYLVDRLATRWGVEPSEDGKVVWFALRCAS